MSLESKISKNVFQGNGTTKTFSFTFRVWKEDQVLVYVGIGDETETDVTSTCTITLSENGGTVTFPTAPAVGMTVVIMRNMPFIQEDQYITGARFDPHEIEDRLDQDCAERQQLLDGVERAVKVPVTSDKKPGDYMAAFWKAVADVLKSVGIVQDAEEYIQKFVAGIPLIRSNLSEVEAGPDGYYLVTGFGDAGSTGNDISNRVVVADGSTEARTLAERFSDVINVRDFGAVGDGVSDDTAAIQAALEYARTIPNLKPVVGTGTYRITGQLRIRRSYMPIHINEIVVSNWSLAEDEPAVWVTAQGCDIYIGRLDCGRLCAGIKLDNSDNVLRDGFYIWHYRGYGLTWTYGNNYIGAGTILFNGSQDEDWDDYETPRPPCILVDGIDSKIVGLSAGRGAPVVKVTENASLNIFHNCHFWRGNSVTDNKPVDPVLIENYSEATNQFIGCYFDNGKIDLYAYGLSIIGGVFLNLTSAVSLSHPYIRYFCNEKAASTSTIQGIKFGIITGIKGISVGFFDYNGHTWAIDLSKVTTMVADGQQPPGAESNVKDSQVIIHVGYNQPYEKVYVGQNFADQNIVLGGGPRIVTRTYENYRRVWKPEETQGFYLFLGSGGQFTGIGESLQSPGTLHLCCGSQNDDGTYNKMSINPAGLFPKYDNKMSLGHPSTRYTQVYVAASAIATSDEREKQNIETYPDNVLDAWGEVELRQFLFKDSVEKKGEDARIHAGVIAQQVVKAFKDKGLDATQYGLLCYDEWPAEYEEVEVVDAPAVLDADGNEVTPAQTHTEQRCVVEAGSRYGIRYSEALCIEAAYQRRRAKLIEQRLDAIEALMTMRG